MNQTKQNQQKKRRWPWVLLTIIVVAGLASQWGTIFPRAVTPTMVAAQETAIPAATGTATVSLPAATATGAATRTVAATPASGTTPRAAASPTAITAEHVLDKLGLPLEGAVTFDRLKNGEAMPPMGDKRSPFVGRIGWSDGRVDLITTPKDWLCVFDNAPGVAWYEYARLDLPGFGSPQYADMTQEQMLQQRKNIYVTALRTAMSAPHTGTPVFCGATSDEGGLRLELPEPWTSVLPEHMWAYPTYSGGETEGALNLRPKTGTGVRTWILKDYEGTIKGPARFQASYKKDGKTVIVQTFIRISDPKVTLQEWFKSHSIPWETVISVNGFMVDTTDEVAVFTTFIAQADADLQGATNYVRLLPPGIGCGGPKTDGWCWGHRLNPKK